MGDHPTEVLVDHRRGLLLSGQDIVAVTGTEDHPAIGAGPERGDGVAQSYVRGQRRRGVGELVRGEIERVAGQHQRAGCLLGFEDLGQLGGEGDRLVGGTFAQTQVRHHQDPTTGLDVHLDPFGHPGAGLLVGVPGLLLAFGGDRPSVGKEATRLVRFVDVRLLDQGPSPFGKSRGVPAPTENATAASTDSGPRHHRGAQVSEEVAMAARTGRGTGIRVMASRASTMAT